MDILRASILKLPTPTQFIPPPRQYLKSDESYFGKGCKIVSALDAGVRAATEVQERGLENSVQDLKEMSKVYFVRHNEISPQAIRNLVNAIDSKYDAGYISLQNKCKEWQQEFQNGMMSAGTGDGVKKTWFGALVEGAVVTSDFRVHLWNLRREKAIHLIEPENETEQEQAVRMEKVVALEASFIDHKARYKDAIVGAINFAKSCKATNDEQFPNYNTPRYINYLSGLKLQLAQMDPFNAESYEDEIEIPSLLKYYRQKSPSDISRFWDQLWTQDNCISFYLQFASTVAVDQMRRDEDGMAD